MVPDAHGRGGPLMRGDGRGAAPASPAFEPVPSKGHGGHPMRGVLEGSIVGSRRSRWRRDPETLLDSRIAPPATQHSGECRVALYLDTGSHPRGGQLDERRGDEGRSRPRTGSRGEGRAGRILAVPRDGVGPRAPWRPARSDGQGDGQVSTGSEKHRVAPPVRLFPAEIAPRCNSMIDRAMASPMPIPCGFVV